MIKDRIKYGINNLFIRKLRTFLTILGIAIAVATVTTLVSLGLGLNVGINEQFESLGGNKIFVQPKGFSPDPTGVVNITRSDAEFIERIPGVEFAYGMYFTGAEVEYDDQVDFGSYVMALPVNEYYTFMKEAFQLEVVEGRYFRRGDAGKVFLGYSYTQDQVIFDERVLLRDNMIINDKKYEVIGFAEKLGNPGDDANIYMVEEDLRELVDEKETVSVIIAQVIDANNVQQVADTITRRLAKRLGQDEGEETFDAQTSEQLIESFGNVINIIVGFIISIGLISLVVGAINIMNTMYTAVLERTQEIGTIKSIGGKNSDIQLIFLIESAIIGVIGGLVGTGVGFVVAFLGASIVDAAGFGVVKFFFPMWLWMLGIGFAVVMAIVSGFLPSRQASKLKPVEALRYE